MIGEWEDIRLGSETFVDFYGDLTLGTKAIREENGVYLLRCKSERFGPKRVAHVVRLRYSPEVRKKMLKQPGVFEIGNIKDDENFWSFYCCNILNVEEEMFFTILDFFAKQSQL